MRFEPLKNLRQLKDIERVYILRTLLTLNWNRTHTARALGVSLRTMRTKVSLYKKMGFPTTAKELRLLKESQQSYKKNETC